MLRSTTTPLLRFIHRPGRTCASAGLATLAVLLLLGGSAAPASSERVSRTARIAGYDLGAAYPNARRARGYFLRGVNEYPSPTSTAPGPQAASLWFQPSAGGAFKQFNTAPYRRCHWDLLRWGPGSRGVLVYLATHAECYADHTAIVFRPGIVYMPKTWAPGEKWDVRGVSGAVYSENGAEVCAGTNTWRSRVLGVEATASGKPVIHTQTNETETLSRIEGAPDSAACPAGQTTTFDWQENFYIGAGITIRRADGSATGSDLGLMRSTGGNLDLNRQVGHPQWDIVFTSWEAMPPADVGIVTTATTDVAVGTAENTIAFTYTAPRGGVHDASLNFAVPPGWTAPVTSDAPGCTTATLGTVTTSGQTITVSAVTLPPNGQMVIAYGAVDGGFCTAADAATAPATPGAPVWQTEVTLSPGDPSTNLSSSPAIRVDATRS
jgi:hypothetical protein